MNDFDTIKELYRSCFLKYGDSPSSIMTPKGRNAIRYSAITPYLSDKAYTICDYGCGLGYLFEFLKKHTNFNEINYTGVDMLPEFIEKCNQKYEGGNFFVLDSNEFLEKKYDIIFASGVFNLKTNENEETSKKYAFERIRYLFQNTKDVFICDFLSDFVDYKQPNSQHFSIQEIATFCVKYLGRKFQIRHDLLPYEFTLIVHKDSNIERPGNIFLKEK